MSGPIDRHTVDQLVVENLPAALRFAGLLTNNPDVASEIVQEALCRVLKRWQSFRGEASFRTWLMQIVLNVDRDRRRRGDRLESVSDGVAAKTAGPNEEAAAAELGESIRKAIDNLPERQREVALMSFGEGLSVSEVAYVLGTTEANVHTCIHLARRRIAQAIGYGCVR